MAMTVEFPALVIVSIPRNPDSMKLENSMRFNIIKCLFILMIPVHIL